MHIERRGSGPIIITDLHERADQLHDSSLLLQADRALFLYVAVGESNSCLAEVQ